MPSAAGRAQFVLMLIGLGEGSAHTGVGRCVDDTGGEKCPAAPLLLFFWGGLRYKHSFYRKVKFVRLLSEPVPAKTLKVVAAKGCTLQVMS